MEEEEEEPLANLKSPTKQEKEDKIEQESFTSSEPEVVSPKDVSSPSPVKTQEREAEDQYEEYEDHIETLEDNQESPIRQETSENESVFDPFVEAQKIA